MSNIGSTIGKWKRHLIIFCFFFVTYGYFWQGGGANQNVRIYLTQAIIDQASFSIDSYKEDAPDLEFVNTGDWSFYRGHYYSSKSPGLSLMAVPPFALAQFIVGHLEGVNPEQRLLACAYFSHLATTVFLSALLCLLIYHLCHRMMGMDCNSSVLLTLAFGLGTLAFPYSGAFYGHQSASFFSFLSLLLAVAIRSAIPGTSRVSSRLLAVASGFSAGAGVFIEPQTFMLAGAVMAYLACFSVCRRQLGYFIAGAVPLALMQFYYNYTCFGHPLASSYSFANPSVMIRVDGSLFGIPSLWTIMQLLFMPYRGLFYTSPVLLMLIPGTCYLFGKREWRAEACCCAVAGLLYFLFIASFYASYGGWAAGPRYLLPIYPWLFLLTLAAFERHRMLFLPLAILSAALNLAIAAVGTEIPSLVENPLLDLILPALMSGMISINPMPLFNFSSYPTLQELSNYQNWPSMLNMNSFNLGELFFPHQTASLLPLFIFWSLTGFLLMRIRRKQSNSVDTTVDGHNC